MNLSEITDPQKYMWRVDKILKLWGEKAIGLQYF